MLGALLLATSVTGLLGLNSTGYAGFTPATADTSLPCSDQAVPLLQVVRLVRRTGDWEACRDECNMEEQCEMFKFKENRRPSKRMCFLLKTVFKRKRSYVSGVKYCEGLESVSNGQIRPPNRPNGQNGQNGSNGGNRPPNGQNGQNVNGSNGSNGQNRPPNGQNGSNGQNRPPNGQNGN